MTATIVRFDAELLVHRAEFPMGCHGAVIVTTDAIPGNPHAGSIRRVTRCTGPTGRAGDHHNGRITEGFRPLTSLCGLEVDAATWIDWTPTDDDPRCPQCHGVAVDEQEPLL